MQLLLLNYEYPPLGGGAGVCTAYHAQGLAALGHEVTVVTTWFKGQQEIETHENLTIHRLHARRHYIHKSNPWEMYSWVRASKKFFKSQKPSPHFDMVLANFAIPGGLVSGWLKRKYGLPFIIISHGQDIPWFFPRQLGLYHAVFYMKIRSLLMASVRNIMLTSSMKVAADKMIPKEQSIKNVVIRNGCDVEKFNPALQAVNTEFTIIFVGRLRGQKDPFTFLKALKLLHKQQLRFKALIIGDGPMRRQIQRFIDEHLSACDVQITGWLNKTEMLQTYHQASLLVSTSKDEGMSIALLEALSTGLFVIATPASGNRDMITEKVNGTIIPFGNAEAAASAILEFYQNRFLRGYQVAPDFLRQFRTHYAWKNIMAEYDEMIKGMNV
jgi:glycosyltransferase involved in cell wall biosynthesis